jgi:hypothetical protein
MKRLLPALAVAALALPAGAAAKGLVALSVCGANGCHTTRDKRELADAMDSAPQADPGRTGAFFRLRQTIGEPGDPHRANVRQVSFWFPALRMVRGDTGPPAGWALPVPATERVLHRLSHGLKAFPAGVLPRQAADAQRKQIADSVGYPHLNPPAPSHAHGGGTSWAWALLAIQPAGLVLAMRRRGRWI